MKFNPIDVDYALLFPGQGVYDLNRLKQIESLTEFKTRYDVICNLIAGDPLQEIDSGNTQLFEKNIISSMLIVLASTLYLDIFLDRSVKKPSFMAGYSVGQWTSLYAANAISYNQLIEIVYKRAQLMDECVEHLPSGMVAVIGVPEPALTELCLSLNDQGHYIAISNYNCPGQYSLSGTQQAINVAINMIDKLNPKKFMRLPVGGAWHSKLLQSDSLAFENYISIIELKKPDMPVIDNVTGDFLSNEISVMKMQLAKQISSPVLWEKGIRRMIKENCQHFLEVGSEGILTKFGFFIDRSSKHTSFNIAS